MEKGYKKLLVWRKADKFVYEIYRATQNFPKEETYGITSQIRRAALSIALNIVEGSGRQGDKGMKYFLNMALGSNSEVQYLMDLCLELGYFDQNTYRKLEDMRQEAGGLLWRFHQAL